MAGFSSLSQIALIDILLCKYCLLFISKPSIRPGTFVWKNTFSSPGAKEKESSYT